MGFNLKLQIRDTKKECHLLGYHLNLIYILLNFFMHCTNLMIPYFPTSSLYTLYIYSDDIKNVYYLVMN